MPKMRQVRAKAKEVEAARAHRSPTLENRRARHEYEILESLESGIALSGTEVKAVRDGGASISEAYVRFRDREAWLVGMHIPPYKQGSFSNLDPGRARKLLLRREQIERLRMRVQEKGLTVVPLRLYFTRGIAKLQLGLARGKKLWDKRAMVTKRDVEREIARHIR